MARQKSPSLSDQGQFLKRATLDATIRRVMDGCQAVRSAGAHYPKSFRTSSASRFRNDPSISSSFAKPLTRDLEGCVLPFRPLSLKLPPKLLIFCPQLSQRLEEGPHSVCFSIITQPQGVHPSVYLSRNCHDARFWSFVGSSHGKT